MLNISQTRTQTANAPYLELLNKPSTSNVLTAQLLLTQLVIAMFKLVHIMAIATHGVEWLDLHFSHAFKIWDTQSLKCSIYPEL